MPKAMQKSKKIPPTALRPRRDDVEGDLDIQVWDIRNQRWLGEAAEINWEGLDTLPQHGSRGDDELCPARPSFGMPSGPPIFPRDLALRGGV